MTDPINPGTTPESTPPAAAWPPPAEPALPPIESTEPGAAAPAQAVQRDSGYAVAGRTRRSTGLRWAVALVGVAIVLVATAAVVRPDRGRPADVSVAVGYMPDDVVQYGEYRLDLPGDQRQKLAEFLSAFPGFDDQATIDAKLDETFDQIVAAVSSNEQTYTADIKPWFGGISRRRQLGCPRRGDTGRRSTSRRSRGSAAAASSSTITDQAKAADWVASLHEDAADHGATTTARSSSAARRRNARPAFAIAVTDKVMLGGTDAAVKAAVDSNGNGKLADDDQFKAAFKLATDDYVDVHVHRTTRRTSASYLDMVNSLRPGALDKTAVDDELVSLVPAWFGSVGRFESDALVASSRLPVGRHRLRRHEPGEHAAGPRAAGHDRLRRGPRRRRGAHRAPRQASARSPRSRQAFDQVDQATRSSAARRRSSAGGATSALVVSAGRRRHDRWRPRHHADGRRGREDRRPTPSAGCSRSAAARPGSRSGRRAARRRDDHRRRLQRRRRDVRPRSRPATSPRSPARSPTTSSSSATAVASSRRVLDAGPGPSLADDARVPGPRRSASAPRTSASRSSTCTRDPRPVRAARRSRRCSADKWAEYAKEYQPYLEPFDAVDRRASTRTATSTGSSRSSPCTKPVAEPSTPARPGPDAASPRRRQSTWQSESG